ncbi:hypothetical protein JQ633_00940 [Bradyrhizobium tropiciagri]|uniref:hypothetical protein n=1 Tax=Bradyrhizobium tropiciagri TaxID=312253 RepID=UPI001BA5E35C|nr:hypothetical protein [Bradyrhizobium tropiciagri]MBR0868906.1 hypothetical protein [Bradyrhizobium tropiciagri]
MSVMSELDFDRQIVENVRRTLEEPPMSPAEEMEAKVDFIVRELDELCAMANNPETVDLVESQKVAFGQIAVRIQLIMGFLLARNPPSFRIVR